MGTPEFRRLVREILKFRKSGWTNLSKDLIRLLAENALKNGQITQEEYDKLMAMLANDSERLRLVMTALIRVSRTS